MSFQVVQISAKRFAIIQGGKIVTRTSERRDLMQQLADWWNCPKSVYEHVESGYEKEMAQLEQDLEPVQ